MIYEKSEQVHVKKIELIKLIRGIDPRLGLVEAKNIVDLWLRINGATDFVNSYQDLLGIVLIAIKLRNDEIYFVDGDFYPITPEALSTDDIYTIAKGW